MASSEQVRVEPAEEEEVDDTNTSETVYIALGKKFKEEKSNLIWVMKNFPQATIVIIHVHCQPKWVLTAFGAKFLYDCANEQSQAWQRAEERRRMKRLIDRYKDVCAQQKVKALHIEDKDVLEGIQCLVERHQIKRLVIGSRSMAKQASLLQRCQILLVRKGNLISTSKAIPDQTNTHAWQEEISKTQVPAPRTDSNEAQTFATPPNELVEGNEIDQDNRDVATDHNEGETAGQEAADHLDRQQSSTEDALVRQQSTETADHLVRQKSPERDIASSDSLKESVVQLEMRLKETEEKLRQTEQEKRALERIMSMPKQDSHHRRKQYHNSIAPPHILEFTEAELRKATNNFSSTKRIGEGGYGPVYKAKLLGNMVAIKMLNPEGNQSDKEYHQELTVLSMVKHPNIIKLIGFCTALYALVYEYLPHHSLNERLGQGLRWQDRIRIIGEQRSALVYLHTSTNIGQVIVHADLKFSNILLDENDVSRLGDFGTARLIRRGSSNTTTTIFRNTNPMGTAGYMDPSFLVTGKLTPQSDIYSFGIIILRLLTGLPELNIAERVEEAIRRGVVFYILDTTAGDWPVANTKQLLQLALKCCDLDRRKRPSLESREWRTLDILKAMASNSMQI